MVEQSIQLNIDNKAPKEECSLVVLGHSNVGKSSLCGRLMVDLGMLDQRQIESYKRLAVNANRESWWLAFMLDSDKFEQSKGTTTEVGRKTFETTVRKYNVSDCPGHQKYASVIINSVLLTDYAIIIVSAVKNEFEAGFSLEADGNEGSTRQHFKILKASNCRKIVVAINKMDSKYVDWSQEVFNERVVYIRSFVGKLFNIVDVDELLIFVPISATHGENVVTATGKNEYYNWYQGKSMLETLDSLPDIQYDPQAPLRMIIQDPVIDEKGDTMYITKIQSGSVELDSELFYFPQSMKTQLKTLYDMDSNQISTAYAGQLVYAKFHNFNVNDNDCQGVILSIRQSPPAVSTTIEVEFRTYQLPTDVYLVPSVELIMHIHGMQIPCEIARIKQVTNQKRQQAKCDMIRGNNLAVCVLRFNRLIAFEKADHILAKPFSQFILRTINSTIAVGQILRYKPDAPTVNGF